MAKNPTTANSTAASAAPAPGDTAPAPDVPAGAPAAPADLAAPPTEEPSKVKARVLVAGAFGKVNEVVVVDEAVAAESGDLDAHPDAVAYAESLAEAE